MPAPLDLIADWPVPAASAAVVGRSGVLAQYGDLAAEYRLASVTKPLVARAAQVAVEEGVVDLDTPAGPPGSTVRHLLAHASGLSMNSAEVMAEPGTRRVYSNYGFQVLAETVEQHSGIEFGRYLAEAVFEPLGMVASRLPQGCGARPATAGCRRWLTWRYSPRTCWNPGRCRHRCTRRRPACSSRA